MPSTGDVGHYRRGSDQTLRTAVEGRGIICPRYDQMTCIHEVVHSDRNVFYRAVRCGRRIPTQDLERFHFQCQLVFVSETLHRRFSDRLGLDYFCQFRQQDAAAVFLSLLLRLCLNRCSCDPDRDSDNEHEHDAAADSSDGVRRVTGLDCLRVSVLPCRQGPVHRARTDHRPQP